MSGGDHRWFKRSTRKKRPVTRESIIIIIIIIIIIKSFRKYVSSIPGKHEVKELQKTVILDTAHTRFGKY